MASDEGRQYDSSEERATRRALAYLLHSVSGFRDQPAADRIEFLQGLGLPITTAEDVAALFEGLFELPAPVFEQVLPERCPIPWRPTVLTPVFHGYQDIDLVPVNDPVAQPIIAFQPGTVLDPLPPVPVRVFYPTLGGTKQNAPFLRACGRYPLVLFLHGQCTGASQEHYRHWYHIPQQLARSGYVVLVPRLDNTDPFGDTQLNLLPGLLRAMHRTWPHRDQLAPTTAIVGHSFGGLLAGRLAARIHPAAFVSLSGEWREASSTLPPPDPLGALNMPAMFMFGTGEDFDANLEGPGAPFFDKVAPPKHKIAFAGGNHFDYLPQNLQPPCGQDTQGRCDLVRLLAADFTALFLTRYMPPPLGGLPRIPASLLPPAVDLTPQQLFYAGSMLVGLSLICGSRECELTHSWFLKDGTTGTLTLKSD